jgi:hypothetical protein
MAFVPRPLKPEEIESIPNRTFPEDEPMAGLVYIHPDVIAKFPILRPSGIAVWVATLLLEQRDLEGSRLAAKPSHIAQLLGMNLATVIDAQERLVAAGIMENGEFPFGAPYAGEEEPA